ncbi:MAG: hypothetical protein ABIH42_05465, partial [Planctomycetota bacterium]
MMKNNKKILQFITSCLLILFGLSITLSFSCSSRDWDSNDDEGNNRVKKTVRKEFPAGEFKKAKVLIQDGYSLYCSAMKIQEQSERDKIIEKALNEYYYPAQSILSALEQDFSNRSEGAKIQDLFEELNLK